MQYSHIQIIKAVNEKPENSTLETIYVFDCFLIIQVFNLKNILAFYIKLYSIQFKHLLYIMQSPFILRTQLAIIILQNLHLTFVLWSATQK